MRILRLTNSNDLTPAVAPEFRASAVVERVVSAATGEPVESMVRAIWPTPDLPDHVGRWIETYQPDVVLIRATSFWCVYESVPLRLERKLGPLGKPFRSAGLRVGDRPWLVNRRAFQLVRQAAARTIGGDPHFTPEEASGVVTDVVRRVLARESPIAVVRGPIVSHNSAGTAAGLRRAGVRLRAFDALTGEACRKLHVRYISAMGISDDDRHRVQDGLHDNESGHELTGELEGRAIAEEWLKVHAR